MSNNERGRTLKFHIFKYNPQVPGDKPRMQTFELEEIPKMTIFIAVNLIREKFDRSLQFDFVCRAGICGSCGMVINGKPNLACRTLTSTFQKPDITLMPYDVPEIYKDKNERVGVGYK